MPTLYGAVSAFESFSQSLKELCSKLLNERLYIRDIICDDVKMLNGYFELACHTPAY